MGLADKVGQLATLESRASKVAEQRVREGVERDPITMPGQAARFQEVAEGYARQVRELENQLKQVQQSTKARIKDLKRVPGRQRKLAPEVYAELKQNLANNPLAQPVIVIRLPDDTLELIAGYNRCQIYEELGREEIDVVIRDLKDTEIVKAAVYSNLLVSELPDYEKYTNLKMIFENTKATHEEISAESGITRSKVQRLMRFGELPDKALEAIAIRPQCIGDDTVEKFAQAVADGKSDLVIEAAERLAIDEKFTQRAAISMVKGPSNKVGSGDKTTPFKAGKRKFGELTVRRGVVGVRFEDADLADKYRKRFEDLMRELAAEHASTASKD